MVEGIAQSTVAGPGPDGIARKLASRKQAGTAAVTARLTVDETIHHMTGCTDDELRRWMIARAEQHERLAQQLRRPLRLLADETGGPEPEPQEAPIPRR